MEKRLFRKPQLFIRDNVLCTPPALHYPGDGANKLRHSPRNFRFSYGILYTRLKYRQLIIFSSVRVTFACLRKALY